MNHIVINQFSDLLKILEHPLYLVENQQQHEESYPNTWALTFSDKAIQQIQASDLEEFLSQLLHKYTILLSQLTVPLPVKFYLWFDEQALQLRFNIIFGKRSLPFSCQVNLLHSPEHIVKSFLAMAGRIAKKTDTIEIINPLDDFDDEYEEEYMLDVYIKSIK